MPGIVRTVTQGRYGLGSFSRTSWKKADQMEPRSMVQRKVYKTEEETWLLKVRGHTRKGPGMTGHLDNGRMPDKVLDVFCLRCPVYSIKAPYLGDGSEPQLHTVRKANFEHILSACQSSLANGKFWWRHDKILSQLVDSEEQTRKKGKQLSNGHHYIYCSRKEEQSDPGLSK